MFRVSLDAKLSAALHRYSIDLVDRIEQAKQLIQVYNSVTQDSVEITDQSVIELTQLLILNEIAISLRKSAGSTK